MGITVIEAQVDAAVRAFVRQNFGLVGSVKLHRLALGLDLLRAPVNVALAPVFLLTRLIALLLRLCRLRRLATWMATRRILLPTRVSRAVIARTEGFITDIGQKGLIRTPPPALTYQAVADYAGVRSAVAEITTTCIVLITGFLIFQTATPGVISMATPVAEMQAYQRAVEGFWAGQRLGRAYYGTFGTSLSVWQVVATGMVLAVLASIVTTFAGVIADPIQVLTGTHRRRLHRLLARLEAATDAPDGLAAEHIAARSADITDIILNIWRGIRG